MDFKTNNQKIDAVLASYADLHKKLEPFYTHQTRPIDIWPDGTSNYAGILNFIHRLTGEIVLPVLCPFPVTFDGIAKFKSKVVSFCINPASEIGTKGFAAFFIQLDRDSHILANVCVTDAKKTDTENVHVHFLYLMTFFRDPKKMVKFIADCRKHQFKFANLEEETYLGFHPPAMGDGQQKA